MIALDEIRIDGGTQSRVELNDDVVAEYAEAFKSGTQMPPVVVFYDGVSHWLADGFHRYFGAKQAGLLEIYEEREPGTQRDAILYSAAANAKHGLRRSNADKRKVVQTLLADPEWSNWSSRAIAKHCCVSHPFVEGIREPHLETLPDGAKSVSKSIPGNSEDTVETRTVTRNGTTYQQNTANRGVKSNVVPVEFAAGPDVSAAGTQEIIDGTFERVTNHREFDELRDRYDDMAANFKATLAENESMARVFEENDQVVAALAEAKRCREMNTVLESRITGLINEKDEAIKAAKSWKRRAERAEATLAKEGA